MKIALGIMIAVAVVWLILVIVAIANPDYAWGPLGIFIFAAAGIIALSFWEYFKK